MSDTAAGHTYGPYSPLRQAGNCYFVSGQVGVTGGSSPEGVAAQTRLALENLQKLLAANNLEMGDVVKTTVYLKNMRDFQKMNDEYLHYFEVPRPARSCVAVASLPDVSDRELLVEIDAVIYKEPS